MLTNGLKQTNFISDQHRAFISSRWDDCNSLYGCLSLISISHLLLEVLLAWHVETMWPSGLSAAATSNLCCFNIGGCVLPSRCCWLCPQRPGRSTSRCCRSPCWCSSSCWWTWRWTGQTWRWEPCGASWSVRRPASEPRTSISFWRTTPARPSTSPAPRERGPDRVSAEGASHGDSHTHKPTRSNVSCV